MLQGRVLPIVAFLLCAACARVSTASAEPLAPVATQAPSPPPAPRSKPLRSPALLTVGAVLSAIGTGLAIYGGYVVYQANQPGQCTVTSQTSNPILEPVVDELGEDFCDSIGPAFANIYGGMLLTLGGLHLAAGVPMVIVGATRRKEAPIPVDVNIGPASASVSVRF
jgi:hypothetical protein